jgi:hypothetical protein
MGVAGLRARIFGRRALPVHHDGSHHLIILRVMPDYFDIIKEPMAFSTIRVGRMSLRYVSE